MYRLLPWVGPPNEKAALCKARRGSQSPSTWRGHATPPKSCTYSSAAAPSLLHKQRPFESAHMRTSAHEKRPTDEGEGAIGQATVGNASGGSLLQDISGSPASIKWEHPRGWPHLVQCVSRRPEETADAESSSDATRSSAAPASHCKASAQCGGPFRAAGLTLTWLLCIQKYRCVLPRHQHKRAAQVESPGSKHGSGRDCLTADIFFRFRRVSRLPTRPAPYELAKKLRDARIGR